MRRSSVIVMVTAVTAVLAACGAGGTRLPAAPPGATAPSTAAPSATAATTPAATAPTAPSTAATAATSATAATAARSAQPATLAPGSAGPPLPFASPEAAMRYLTAAYNRHDDAALRSVTTPAAREALVEMRSEAVNLRLDRCTRQPAGDYVCTFTHDYPASMHRAAGRHGSAIFTVGPATKPGWYMTVLQSCG